MKTATTDLGPPPTLSEPKYLGRDGYLATQAQIDALPDYHEAFKQYGYRIPTGQYRTISASTHEPAIIDVTADPLSSYNRECFSHVQIVPVRDQIITKLDEENQFSKY
jgi:hypothetical protein